MKRCCLIFFYAFALLGSSAYGQEIKAFFLTATNDSTLSDSVRSDLFHMRSFLSDIGEQLNLPVTETLISGNRFTYQNAVNGLSEFEVGEDDIVLFYYSGHAYRVDSMDKQWPALFFGYQSPGLDYSWVIETIQSRNPRLFIAIADACNNVMEEKYAPDVQPRGMAARNKVSKSNYEALFLETEGSIIICSAKPGDFAWGNGYGGFYTNAFIKHVKREALKKRPSWEPILLNSYYDVLEHEEPIFELYIH